MNVVSKRLGIITGTTSWRDNSGRLWINHSIGRLCEALRDRVPGVRIALPVLPQHQTNLNYELDFTSEMVVPLPPLVSTLKAQTHLLKTRRILREFEKSVDLLFIRMPFQLPAALLHLTRPKLLHVVSNPVEVIRESSDYQGIMRFLANRFALHSERTMRRLVAEPKTRVCTNGEEMWYRLNCQHGRVVVSSCLKQSEIRPRTDFTLNDPPRLLFIGYFRPEKGISVLIDAFEQLRRQRPLKLTLAGGKDRVTGAEAEILQRVESSPFRDDISLPGNIPYGEQLFELFRTHDVLIQPSLSEGTPRTLVEARAFGCPVIASRVGGIPSSVLNEKDGLLVEPGSAEQLAEATARMLDSDQLRLHIIKAGLSIGGQRSLESFADELVAELAQVSKE